MHILLPNLKRSALLRARWIQLDFIQDRLKVNFSEQICFVVHGLSYSHERSDGDYRICEASWICWDFSNIAPFNGGMQRFWYLFVPLPWAQIIMTYQSFCHQQRSAFVNKMSVQVIEHLDIRCDDCLHRCHWTIIKLLKYFFILDFWTGKGVKHFIFRLQ